MKKLKQILFYILTIAVLLVSTDKILFAENKENSFYFLSKENVVHDEYAKQNIYRFVSDSKDNHLFRNFKLGKGIKILNDEKQERTLYPIYLNDKIVATFLVATVEEEVGGIYSIAYSERLNEIKELTSKDKPLVLKSFDEDLWGIIENKAYNEFLDKYFIILIISFIIIGFTFGILGEKLKEERNELFKSIKLVNMSIFVALSVAINTMRVGSVSFGGFPIILSGYLLGPIPGFIVGAMSDIVGFIIRPSALGFNPVFILTSALTGLIPVVVTNLLGNKYPRFEMHKVLIGIFIGQILTSVIMVPIFSTIIYGKHSFWFLAYRAFIKQVISIPIYAFLTTTIVDRVTKVINFDYK